ncbi:MAG: ATP-binding cassette domain-containing protein [Gemmatimonadota bacterium]|nr:ATP-binding cassette domain-containing protein [Gemmatimonadota bacterium]
MVEVANASHVAGGKRILDDVTARFRDGAFNVILGPNGAGKSSLLKVATGILRPTSGHVMYDGDLIGSIAPVLLARRRAVLSQHIELVFPLSARDVVLMGRYPHYGQTPSREDIDIVDHALDLVGMQDRALQPYPTLSGGERQKVQLARVLAQIWNRTGESGRKYLFLDEPTASLDIHYQIHLLDVARTLLSRGCTVIAILHDINVAIHYGDNFFVMNDGKMAAVAEDPAELTTELIETVFRVCAHRVSDPATGGALWRFAL